MPTIIELNCETNEQVEREATAEEAARLDELQSAFDAEKQAKAEAKAKRQALLDKLGITEEEARLLLGGN